MANLSAISNILNHIDSSISNSSKDIWYGSMAKDVKLQIENILNDFHNKLSISLIEKQITNLENALKEKYYLIPLVEDHARALGNYHTLVYKINHGEEVTSFELNASKRLVDDTKSRVVNKQNEINAYFTAISRFRATSVTPLRTELPVYKINIEDVEDVVITNGLKKVNSELEWLVDELKTSKFDNDVITKQTVAPYKPVSVNFNIGNYRNRVVSNMNDLINLINRLISKIELHIDNITMFENNEAVEIPLEESNVTQSTETTTEKQETYSVKKGDTLIQIAAIYGVNWKDIYNANKEKIPNGDPSKLEIGTNLVIPGKNSEVAEVSEDNIETIGNEKLEASSEIPKINKITDFSTVSKTNWAIGSESIVDGEYKPTMKLNENGKMVDKNGNQFRITSSMSSYYNNDVYESNGGRSGHKGTDISTSGRSDYNTEVQTIGPGIVIEERNNNSKSGYGNYVRVLHEVIDEKGEVKYTVSTYAHLSDTSVKVGDVIDENQTIGKMGNTGNSTGVHLHLEMNDVDLTKDEMAGKTPEDVIKLVEQKGIDQKDDFGKDSYYDMGVYYKNNNYL